jgi:hypothetical protein
LLVEGVVVLVETVAVAVLVVIALQPQLLLR